MITPAQAIAALDKALAQAGQTVKLRTGNTAVGEVTVRASVRGYKPEELVGVIKQGDKKVILSPTGLGDFGIPKAGQFAVVGGIPRAVQGEPEAIYMDDVLVRINMTVRG